MSVGIVAPAITNLFMRLPTFYSRDQSGPVAIHLPGQASPVITPEGEMNSLTRQMGVGLV